MRATYSSEQSDPKKVESTHKLHTHKERVQCIDAHALSAHVAALREEIAVQKDILRGQRHMLSTMLARLDALTIKNSSRLPGWPETARVSG